MCSLLSDFMDAVGSPPARRGMDARVRELLAVIERALAQGDKLPPPPTVMAPSGSLSPSVSLAPSISGALAMSFG